MTKLTDTYNKAFFEWHRPLKEDYLRIGRYLMTTWDDQSYRSILDIGCGNGYFLEAFPSHTDRIGIEASPHCLPEAHRDIRRRILLLDASIQFILGCQYELVICTEVGEHLPEVASDTLVNNITNHAHYMVFFSAATPGQGGHDHLNEQPHEYWIEKFSERGFTVDEKRTKEIREFAATTALSWIRDNAIMFTRVLC